MIAYFSPLYFLEGNSSVNFLEYENEGPVLGVINKVSLTRKYNSEESSVTYESLARWDTARNLNSIVFFEASS